VSDHSNDEMQVLKSWWAENGTSLVVAVCVALAAVSGWSWWKNKQAANVEAGFAQYQTLVKELQASQASGDELSIAQADHIAQQIKEDFSKTYYASFSAFYKAKQAVQDKDWALAQDELQWVIDQNFGAEIDLVARHRLAKVQYQTEAYDDALATLNVDDQAAYAMAYDELRGDILLAKGEHQQAVDAYDSALALGETSRAQTVLLLREKLTFAKGFL